MLKTITETFIKEIWHQDVHSMKRSRQIVVYWVRMFHVLVQDLMAGYLSLRATSLVYTSLLSLVPLFAFGTALLKGFGFQNKLQPFLLDTLSYMGPKGVEMTIKIIDFVNNVSAGVLGTFGLVMLLYTVISLVRKVETAFNFVWRVREPRTLAQSLAYYLGVIMVGPLLMVTAFTITAAVSNHATVQHFIDYAPVGVVYVALGKVLPYVLVIAAFTFMYMFVPHTHVQFRSAITGAVLAGVLWELSSWAFTTLSYSSTRLTAIYSSFAIILMFVIWLYVSWMIVLVGIQVAFYVQNPELVRHGLRRNEIGGRTFERVALHIMYLIGRAYEESAKPWSREQLARRLHLPTDIILDVIDRLQQRSLIMRISSRRNIARYAPARDMGKITLRDIVMAVRQNPKSGQDADKHLKSVPQVESLMATMDRAMDNVLGSTTLKDFVGEGDPAELHTKTVMRARHT